MTSTNSALAHKNCIKFLGLLIDEKLSWKDHSHTLTTKISKTVGLIAKLRHIRAIYAGENKTRLK